MGGSRTRSSSRRICETDGRLPWPRLRVQKQSKIGQGRGKNNGVQAAATVQCKQQREPESSNTCNPTQQPHGPSLESKENADKGAKVCKACVIRLTQRTALLQPLRAAPFCLWTTAHLLLPSEYVLSSPTIHHNKKPWRNLDCLDLIHRLGRSTAKKVSGYTMSTLQSSRAARLLRLAAAYRRSKDFKEEENCERFGVAVVSWPQAVELLPSALSRDSTPKSPCLSKTWMRPEQVL